MPIHLEFTHSMKHIVSSIFKINSNFQLIVWSTHSLRPIANLSDEEVQEIVSVMFTVGDEYIITGSKVRISNKLFRRNCIALQGICTIHTKLEHN